MLMTMASKAQATVQITDSNWKTLISSQNIQIEMLTRILNKLDTLTTREELADFMEQQIELLQQHAEETVQTMEAYQKKMMHSADSLEKECQWTAKNLENCIQNSCGRIECPYLSKTPQVTNLGNDQCPSENDQEGSLLCANGIFNGQERLEFCSKTAVPID